MPFGTAQRTPSGSRFDRLFAEGRDAVLTGTHQAESAPANNRPRWAVGAVLRPDARAAQVIEQVARAAAGIVGDEHWLAGAVSSSHLSLRRHLERYRRPVLHADPLVARYAAALRIAVKDIGPIRFTISGLTLTPVSVMASAAPADGAAKELAAAFGAALRVAGCRDAGSTPDIWYVNLVYFTGPIRDPRHLVAWVAARRHTEITRLHITGMQIVRWHYTGSGMVPVVLAAAAGHTPSWQDR